MTVTLTLTGVTNIPMSPATEHLYTPSSVRCAFDRFTVCPDESNCTLLGANGDGGGMTTPEDGGAKRVTGVEEPD